MQWLVLLVVASALVAPVPGTRDGADWASAEKQYSKDILGGNEFIVRERAIKLSSEFKELGATKLLLAAMVECCAEQRAMQKRYDGIAKELGGALRMDPRLLPNGQKELLEERKALGKRLLEEETLCNLCVDLLAKRKGEESPAWLGAQIKKVKQWSPRCRLIEVLGKAENTSALTNLHKSLADKDPRIRVYVADALGSIKDPSSVEPLCAALKDKDQQVRYSVIQAIEELHSPLAVPYLITALSGEEGLLRQDLSVILEELTGQSLGIDGAAWSRWWTDNQSEFIADGKKVSVKGTTKDKSDPFTYYGIKTYSKKVVFILDISDSMNDSAEETVVPRSGIPKRTGNIRPKILVARDHLTQTLVDLPEATTFNIVLYNKFVSSWKPKMMPANKRNKNDAISFVMNLQAKEATNICGALEEAFSFAGSNLGDKYYPATVDTIFFLTDGKATEGRLQDTQELLKEVRRINKIGKVKLHTIGVGYLHDRPFLKTMAEQNGGSYVNIQ